MFMFTCATQAHDYAEKAVQAAEESGDLLWQMNTNALLAQIELASEACVDCTVVCTVQ